MDRDDRVSIHVHVRWQGCCGDSQSGARGVARSAVLNDEFLKPLQVTRYRLAKAIGVDPRHNPRGNPWTLRAGVDRIGRQ